MKWSEMTRKIMELEGGSLLLGELPEGCIRCARGSKMVLLVTGLCGSSCFYCPLSGAKKDKDVIFADEMQVNDDYDIFIEADSISSEGAGISGGDPLCVLERTVHYIRMLKERYGPDYHIHLYTSKSDASDEAIWALKEAGLDEIRFHPQSTDWSAVSAAVDLDLIVGIEVPSIPSRVDILMKNARRAEEMGVSFMNINELEASETNFASLVSRGLRLVSLEASAIAGSRETAEEFLGWASNATRNISIHFCSASYKDSIQMRNRLERRLKNIIRPFEERAENDPLLILGIIRAPHGHTLTPSQLFEVANILQNEFDVPDDLLNVNTQKGRVEVAPWILDEIVDDLRNSLIMGTTIEMGIAYEYPSWDRLQVMFNPL